MKYFFYIWTIFCTVKVIVAISELSSEPIVREIIVQNSGFGKVDPASVTNRIALKTGMRLDHKITSQDIRSLLSTGAFSDVSVFTEPVNDGVRVIYAVSAKLRLAEPVIVHGARHFSQKRVREILGLEAGDLVDEHELGVRIEKLKEKYRSDYYYNADVKGKIEITEQSSGLCKVIITIEEGKYLPVGKINFSGNANIRESLLRKAMKQPARWNPIGFILWKKSYTAEELEECKKNIIKLYTERGFLDMEIENFSVKAEDNRLVIDIAIKEGNQYRIGEVVIEGSKVFSEAELLKKIPLKRGNVASSELLRQAEQQIIDSYAGKGYIDTSVRPVYDGDPSRGILNVKYIVAEGKIAYIRNIFIQGNERTKDKVIRREILVRPGDTLDSTKIRRSQRILENLGYFSSVRSRILDTPVADEKDVVFEVEEKETGMLSGGASFSEIDRLMGYIQISQGNFDITGWPYFTGGGQKLKLDASVGSRRTRYNISFTEPWFCDQPLALGIDFYRSTIDQRDYDVKRTGGMVSISKRLSSANKVRIAYKIEKTDITHVADTNEYFYVDNPAESYFFPRGQQTLKSGVEVAFIHDTRDHPFIPTRGTRAMLRGETTGGPLGGDTDLYNIEAEGSLYFPLYFGHVLSMYARYEVVDCYGDTENVPIDDLLFAGGGRTIRGFKYRHVGPKVFREIKSSTGETSKYIRPVGGKSLALGKIEYTIPLPGPFRAGLFSDAGNVWRDSFEFEPSDVAISAGIGIRIDIPFFPLRLDWARPVRKDHETTATDVFSFWIGYSY
jgi:outer membrane protein insertion porin family